MIQIFKNNGIIITKKDTLIPIYLIILNYSTI